MSKHNYLEELFTDIADAIREKTGETDAIAAVQFPSIIRKSLQVIPTLTLINFTISGTSYQAEEGMTWNEWLSSGYNTDGYFDTEGTVCHSSGMMVWTSNFTAVSYLDVIIAGENYQIA